MKKMLAAALAACFLCGCAGPGEQEPPKTDYIKEGTECLRQGSYEAAKEMFEKELEEEAPDLAEAYRGLGLAAYEQREYAAARQYLRQALDEGGQKTPTIYHLMGVCAMNLEDYDGALADFEEGTAQFQNKGAEGSQAEEANGVMEDSQADAAAEGTQAEEDVEGAVAIREMRFNRILCYEKKQEWKNAYAAAVEYLEDYPNDEKVKKEAEFLQTR